MRLDFTNNNCIFAVFNEFYGVKGNVLKPSVVRQELKIPEGTKVHYSLIPKISEYYNKKFNRSSGYYVINELQEAILFSPSMKDAKDNIQICLLREHYTLFTMPYSEDDVKTKCKECGRKLKANNTKHKCDPKRVSYKDHVVDKKKAFVKVQSVEEKEKLDYSKVVSWDLETFIENKTNNMSVPYASGWMNNGEYKVVYGKDCMNKTIDEFITYENKIISAFNGSRFDFYMLIDAFTERGIPYRNLILSGGRIISLTYGTEKKENKVFDICLFINSSLDDACKEFKIKNAKSSFDHTLIQSWDDTVKYQPTVQPYLEKDVLALNELFMTFNDMMYEQMKVNITSYITLSHMAYNIWASMLESKVEIPNDKAKYDFIKLATYGGRCYPVQKRFVSKLYEGVRNGTVSYDELRKSGDFIFNADVSSLYPASMRGVQMMSVAYPKGKSRWSDKPKEEFDNGTIGFYNIEFTCPDIRVPILPRRKLLNGRSIGVEWSLKPGRGVYSSVDIQNAIQYGYNVTFIDKCLAYDDSGDLFSKYVDKYYALKTIAEKEGNDVKKQIAKLMLNALYGKTLQKAIFDTSKVIHNVNDYHDFLRKYELTGWNMINGKQLILTGTCIDQEDKITKPAQLGAFVTAYSRRLMIFYMSIIDPTLKTPVFTYSDTDSLHILGKHYYKVLDAGYIKPKSAPEIGYLSSDIKNEGLIINEINLAPKTYMYEYINNKNEVKCDDHATMKCKGIPTKHLQHEHYRNDEPVPINMSGLKKKGMNLTKADKSNDVHNFSVVAYEQTRTFNLTSWNQANFRDNQWYPEK